MLNFGKESVWTNCIRKFFCYGENHIDQNMHPNVINIWYEDAALKDYRNVVLIPLYNGIVC